MFKATELFQFIHTDFGDPYPFIQEDHKYYISFLNDYSGAIHVYFLKNKDKAFLKFKKYKAAIELQSNKKIKFICFNDEDEYKNLEFDKVLKKLNIQ